MTEITWPTPYGYTTFCDDIRDELNGKTTLVGIYGADMLFNIQLPVTLPKLGLVVNYFERPGESTEPIRIEIFMPDSEEGKPFMVAELPHEQMRNFPIQADPEVKDPRIGAIFNMILSPLTIAKEGRIKVQAIR